MQAYHYFGTDACFLVIMGPWEQQEDRARHSSIGLIGDNSQTEIVQTGLQQKHSLR